MRKRAIFLLIFAIEGGFYLFNRYAAHLSAPAISLDSLSKRITLSTSSIPRTARSEIEYAYVSRVIDGDTIDVVFGFSTERVRYIGMDAPETVDPDKPVQCFGPEASTKNKELVEGKTVRLEKDVSERDKYGRLLRFVYLPSATSSIDLELVREGYARVFTDPPDVRYASEFLASEQEARDAGRGLWSACPP